MAVELERPRRLGERGVVSPQNPMLIRPRSDGAVEIYREPGSDGCSRVTSPGPDQAVSPFAFPDIAFRVADFFA